MSKPERHELPALSKALENQPLEEVLRWAVATYHPKIAMATAFGAEGCVILHCLAQIRPPIYIFNLDTGYQFPETLETRRRLMNRYGLEIHLVQAELSVASMEEKYGGPIYHRQPDLCCHIRKIQPLVKTLEGFDAWISSIRRDQTPERAQASLVEWDQRFGLVKINPLLHWTQEQVWQFIRQHDIPYNPLHDQGYPSIGCWPCTRPVQPGEEARAGRWPGLDKTECGLHQRYGPLDHSP
jgi:phosphoadenosine phosphosulfate reductase